MDEALAALIRSAAFDAAVREFGPAEADDVAQNTFMVLDKLAKVSGLDLSDPAKVAGLAAKRAFHVGLDLRKEARRRAARDAAFLTAITEAERVWMNLPRMEESEFTRTEVEAALDSLPDRQREVLNLKYADTSNADIAERLGVPLQTVKNLHQKAMARLAQRLAHLRNRRLS